MKRRTNTTLWPTKPWVLWPGFHQPPSWFLSPSFLLSSHTGLSNLQWTTSLNT